MNGKDMQQDMAQHAMDNAAAERAAAEWDAKTDPLNAFKADGTETIRPRDNIRSPLAYGMAEECAWDSGLRHLAIGLTDCGNDVQLITEDGWHLALIQQDPAQEWAEFIVKAVNNHDALVRVIRLLGQADALGYVGEQAAPIMEEALSLAADILKREVN